MPKNNRASQRKTATPTANAEESSENSTPINKPLYRHKELSPRARIITLVLGDTLCFLIFVTIGANQHGEGVNLVYNLWLALPFVAAWFLTAPFLGAFRYDITTEPRQMLVRTLCTWLVAWPVGMTFRWLLVDRVTATALDSFLSFAVVTFFFNTGLLLLWRWPFALNNNLRKQGL